MRLKPLNPTSIWILILIFTFNVGLQAKAQTASQKIRVGIEPAEDRWITLTDGSRVYEGLNISYLLGQRLFDSQKYSPVFISRDQNQVHPTANILAATEAKTSDERMNQIPHEWMQWTSAVEANGFVQTPHVASSRVQAASFPVAVDVSITPVVETLVYSSGQRSNRVVFGFSPDHLNPFNAGKAGALDNEYVANSSQQQTCIKPDFFSGQFNPAGWGPFLGNFGSDLDEGVVFNILGYGFGFKKKHFDVVSQIRFLVDDHHSGLHSEYVFQTKGSGDDVFVAGSYSGFELGVEIQRRKTLLDALIKILPQIIDSLLSQVDGQPVSPSVHLVANSTGQSKVFQTSMSIPLNNAQRAAVQSSIAQPCFGKNTNWIVQTVDTLFSLYAWWKYHHVLDQSPHHDLVVLPAPSGPGLSTSSISVPKIAIIDSGVDYNDGEIKSHFVGTSSRQILGFDFISWDGRPSDDNGHGTAAAKLLTRLVKGNFIIVPTKVIGAHGETHSSAVYDGFDYAIKNKVDVILVPWSSQPNTLAAYKMGAEKAAEAGISVFVPPGALTSGPHIFVPQSNSKNLFKARGLGGAGMQLNTDGVAAVEMLAQWLQSSQNSAQDLTQGSNSLGGSHVPTK